MENQGRLKVYYDGLCKVCSKEMDFYRKQKGAERIEFIDICAPQFDAVKEGLDPHQVHKVMHVRRLDGSLAVRVEAFVEIWKALPKYQWLAKMAGVRPVRELLELGYSGFVVVRPLLPRWKSPNDCQDSPYCEVKNAEIPR